jgi:DNA repair protein RadA/Sms
MVAAMPRATTVFVCSECGGETAKWAGQCPHCRAWNTLSEFKVTAAARVKGGARKDDGTGSKPVPITTIADADQPRVRLRWGELNRVLGGGVVPGSVVLVGGEPGVGKSTLLMHVARQVADFGTVLYATGEESARQVRMRAARVGGVHEAILLLAETEVDAILAAAEEHRPQLVIVDSIQTVHDPALEAAAGTVSQVRECAARLLRHAKETGAALVLVGHVTKEGTLAGPRVLEHMVDTVLYLEGERGQDHRILRATKNRFGATDEIGIFTMGEGGLAEVEDPSAALLEGSSLNSSGTVVLAAIEGTRPLLVELQALVAKDEVQMARRSVNGIDLNRLHMVCAVAAQRLGLPLARHDIYVNVAGGFRVIEPAADLGLALCLWSSSKNRPLPGGTVAIGELGLTGEVRRVGQLERRLNEAARRGFTRAFIPRGALRDARSFGLELLEVGDLDQAVAFLDRSPIAPGASFP